MKNSKLSNKFPIIEFPDGLCEFHILKKDFDAIVQFFADEKKKEKELKQTHGKLITKGKARKLLSVEKKTVTEWCKSGKLKTVVIRGKEFVVLKSVNVLLNVRSKLDIPAGAVALSSLRKEIARLNAKLPKKDRVLLAVNKATFSKDGMRFAYFQELQTNKYIKPSNTRIYVDVYGKRYVSKDDETRILGAFKYIISQKHKYILEYRLMLATKAEAASYLDMKDRTARDWCKSGKLKTLFLGGREYIILRQGGLHTQIINETHGNEQPAASKSFKQYAEPKHSKLEIPKRFSKIHELLKTCVSLQALKKFEELCVFDAKDETLNTQIRINLFHIFEKALNSYRKLRENGNELTEARKTHLSNQLNALTGNLYTLLLNIERGEEAADTLAHIAKVSHESSNLSEVLNLIVQLLSTFNYN
ncbi:MAG: hypothetical protein ABIH99_01245 [Candidatus Micrarchaeota archaeon]